jgi:hypothetical protein
MCPTGRGVYSISLSAYPPGETATAQCRIGFQPVSGATGRSLPRQAALFWSRNVGSTYGERSDFRRFVPWSGETGWKPILHCARASLQWCREHPRSRRGATFGNAGRGGATSRNSGSPFTAKRLYRVNLGYAFLATSGHRAKTHPKNLPCHSSGRRPTDPDTRH